MSSRSTAALLVFTLFVVPAACADDMASDAPAVVLISFDGTRPAEVEALPAFRRIAARGLAATPLRPVFPTNTFPNHVTLVTGVGPARHGIVNNSFRDPERGSFRYENDPSWLEVEPLWSILAGAGLRSAAYHWVGSQGPWRSGRGPEQWHEFDGRVPEQRKVAQIIEWLERPAPQRPALITSWFRGSDGSGHRHGPDTEATRRALRKQDKALGALLDFLDRRERWATTTLFVVSDHGMATVERRVDLAAALDSAGARATLRGGGGFGTLTLHRGAERDRAAHLERILRIARGLGLKAWPRGGSADGLDDDNARFGDVLVMAPVGVGIVRAQGAQDRPLSRGTLNGSHGYTPDASSMQAMIAAAGRGVRPGAVLRGPRSVDVAPTILGLLGVPVPAWVEGRSLDLERKRD